MLLLPLSLTFLLFFYSFSTAHSIVNNKPLFQSFIFSHNSTSDLFFQWLASVPVETTGTDFSILVLDFVSYRLPLTWPALKFEHSGVTVQSPDWPEKEKYRLIKKGWIWAADEMIPLCFNKSVTLCKMFFSGWCGRICLVTTFGMMGCRLPDSRGKSRANGPTEPVQSTEERAV